MTASPPKIDINKLRQMISYDPETGFLKWIVPRRGHSAGSPAGYSHRTGYTFLEIENRHYAGHRVAWAVVHGKWPRYIDHINGNRSDNRLANLREATWQQNQANRPTFKNNHAGMEQDDGRSRDRNPRGYGFGT